jgi:hypothetical protein
MDVRGALSYTQRMETQELKDNLEIIKRKVPALHDIRIEGIYTDFLVLTVLFEELNDEVRDKDLFDYLDDKQENEWRRLIIRHRQLVSILKAIFIFADVFISVLISEVTDTLGLSLYKYLTKPRRPLENLSTISILPAYCVVVYRNKVIAHHDKRRMNSFVLSGRGDDVRLIPFPEKFGISPQNVSKLKNLKLKYIDTIEGLRSEDNNYELLRILYYGIPVGELGKVNEDRKTIDQIVQDGGCKSMTSNEILKSVDDFFVAVVKAI